MISRDALLNLLPSWGVEHVTGKPDNATSVSSKVIRGSLRGRRVVAVGSDADVWTQITALLVLADLHLMHAPIAGAGAAVSSEATLILCDGRRLPQVTDPIGTLLAAMAGAADGAPRVEVLVGDADGSLRPVRPVAPSFSSPATYLSWSGLLHQVPDEPPRLLRDAVQAAGLACMRAYPMLTAHPWWSLRMEGLEVGRFRGEPGKPAQGWLGVGKPGAAGDSGARAAWKQAAGQAGEQRIEVTESSIADAAEILGRMADLWLARAASGTVPARQNEHALESRILRGAVTLTTAEGRTLQPIRPHPVVNWGSQFPTRWDSHTKTAGRYLDALLRDGDIPWAVEMKVEGGSGFGYYRKAVAQAVLYRHFIRSAVPLADWFTTRYGLDPTRCRACVVVPEPSQASWLARLQALCAAFGVELITVPVEAALLSPSGARR